MCTIPLGPQIQALQRSEHGATAVRYEDIILNLSERLALTSDDTTMIFSLDGAQLYQNKKSDTWIAIWIITDYDPKTRYRSKHVLPALIVPGPNKPKNIDSYLFRGFHHLSALQRENNGAGMRVWDALKRPTILSRIISLFGTADAIGLTEIDGLVTMVHRVAELGVR